MQLPNHDQAEVVQREDIRQPDYLNVVQALLKEGREVRFTVTGQSMRPFLKGGERVTLRQELPVKLRRGDIIFTRGCRGVPVLHRIVKKTTSDGTLTFITQGDGLACQDDPVPEGRILGRVIRVESADRSAVVDLDSAGWRVNNYFLARLSRLRMAGSGFAMPAPGRRFLSFCCRACQSLVARQSSL